MRIMFLSFLFTGSIFLLHAQNKASIKPRPLSMTEYNKAKTYTIKDLDKDTYAKFDNQYILDRYEMRKPYIVTGDDGLKKRIDLYKLIAKDSMQELGTIIFYTNEKGKTYTALQPNFTADGKVWEKYFEDIHTIDKEEKNFVLKLSYILSKEMSFQLYKAINNGKNMKDEAGTYGASICFPGNNLVAMADGSKKMLSQIKAGDQVITINPNTRRPMPAVVTKLVEHEKQNYAMTKLLLIGTHEQSAAKEIDVTLTVKVLQATPNHPMLTTSGKKKMGDIVIGDKVICMADGTRTYKIYTVHNKEEAAGGMQKVYNIEVSKGSTFVMNGVMVLQK